MNQKTIVWLEDRAACFPGLDWCRSMPDEKTAWEKCQRGDWMMWLLARVHYEEGTPEHRKLFLVKSRIARCVLPIFEAGYPQDKRPRRLRLEVVRYAKGLTDEVPGALVEGAMRAAFEAKRFAEEAIRKMHEADEASLNALIGDMDSESLAIAAASNRRDALIRCAIKTAQANAAWSVADAGHLSISSMDGIVQYAALAIAGEVCPGHYQSVAKNGMRALCANIVRQIFPEPPDLSKIV